MHQFLAGPAGLKGKNVFSLFHVFKEVCQQTDILYTDYRSARHRRCAGAKIDSIPPKDQTTVSIMLKLCMESPLEGLTMAKKKVTKCL